MDALKHGICNLDAHLDNMKKFGVPVVVAVNAFPTDTDEEMDSSASTVPSAVCA